MESIVKVTATPAEIADAEKKGELNIRYLRFLAEENGIDPSVLSKEEWRMHSNTRYVYELKIRHCDIDGRLKAAYASLGRLAAAIRKKGALSRWGRWS